MKLVDPSDTEAQEEQLAQEIDTESHEKAENFSFSKCQISVGEEIEYYGKLSMRKLYVMVRCSSASFISLARAS